MYISPKLSQIFLVSFEKLEPFFDQSLLNNMNLLSPFCRFKLKGKKVAFELKL